MIQLDSCRMCEMYLANCGEDRDWKVNLQDSSKAHSKQSNSNINHKLVMMISSKSLIFVCLNLFSTLKVLSASNSTNTCVFITTLSGLQYCDLIVSSFIHINALQSFKYNNYFLIRLVKVLQQSIVIMF